MPPPAAAMNAPDLRTRLIALNVGKAVPYTRAGSRSAIDKRAVAGPVRVTLLGLAGDEQGDLRVHGGPDKAIHHYPYDHYPAWRDSVAHPLLQQPGAFGENFATLGWTEATVHFGDIMQAGTAVLQVSQGRQPCWKLNDRFNEPQMARWLQSTGRTGWYYRVLEEGTVATGDELRLRQRPFPRWPLARLTDMLFNRTLDLPLLREAAQLPLPASWLKVVNNRLQREEVESWSRRLDGPERG